MDGWLSLCFIAGSTLLAIWFLDLSRRRNNPNKKLPPGPWTLPIVGSLLHVVGAFPHRTIAELSRRHGPLMHLRLGEVATMVVSSAEVAAMRDEYIRELGESMELVPGFCLVDIFPSSRLVRWLNSVERRMRRSYGRMQSIIADILDERKAARAAGDGSCSTDDEDLLEVLLRLQAEDSLEFPLTTEIIGAVMFDMFAGGTDTTATVLEWAMSELVNNPEAMTKAQLEVREVLGEDRVIITNCDIAKLPYMRMVIKEVLRLHPPIPLVPRMARDDCNIMGYDMLKGTNVLVNVFAISRDSRYWENPEEFKPERFENNNMDYNVTYFEFIPFGAGRRQCPGMFFGMSTVHITLANMLYHFNWMLPEGACLTSFDMSEKFGLTIRRRYDLQLRAIPWVGVKDILLR
ncbi:5-epiaristolochene 1,3-dihydroxylase [Triticum urartu]|uniref:5-epiaristolochene 1,3-dihydroxylase n=1 Tax=Triticum urartu TaxID=4572 RepID=M8B302_TRIUA|nr:5-epiaristolochene 1,3-dihydroxylase [Triticum urartu]